MKIEIKNRYNGTVIFSNEEENNTISKTLNKYIDSELKKGNSYADLSGADLRSANLSKKIISVSRIGSRKEMTTHCFDDDTIWCGCFTGSLEEFENKVNITQKNNTQYLK